MTAAAPFSTGRDPVGRRVMLGVAALACAAPWLWVVAIDDLSPGQQRFGAAVWSVVALFVVRRTVCSWTARLSVDAHGRLSQRNGPFGTEHVDLGRLRRVEGREEGTVLVRSTGGPVTRVTPVLDVEDAHGARVRVAPGSWAHEDLVVAAVAHAATVARCPVTGGELFGLPDRGGVPAPGALDPTAVPARPLVLRMLRFRRAGHALLALVFVGVGALVLFVGAGAADAMGPGFVNGTRIVALVAGVVALAVLVPGLHKRITLDPGGSLAVSRPTFVPRLDLSTLAQVRVTVGPWTRVGWWRAEKATTLVLTDRSGRTAEVVDALWEEPRPLVLAVAAWAARTGAALDGDALRHLTTGTPPTAFGIGRSLR
jgi:hypothetical protein